MNIPLDDINAETLAALLLDDDSRAELVHMLDDVEPGVDQRMREVMPQCRATEGELECIGNLLLETDGGGMVLRYQTLVRYNHRRGNENGQVRWILDIL